MKLTDAVELYRTGVRPAQRAGWWVVISTKTRRIRAVVDSRREDPSQFAAFLAERTPSRQAVFLTQDTAPRIGDTVPDPWDVLP